MNIQKGLQLLLIACLAFMGFACCQAVLEPLNETVEIDGAVGKLQGDIHRPAVNGKTCPVTIIYHGLTGQRKEDALTTISDSLNAHGIATALFDFNGHGQSEGEFINMTLDNELIDAEKIFGYMESLEWVDKDRMFIAGHSQGGLISGVLAGKLGVQRIKGVILLAPAACIHTMALQNEIFGTCDVNNIPDSIPLWGHHFLGKPYFYSAREMDALALAGQYGGPVLVLQGTNDGEDIKQDAVRYPEFVQDCTFKWLEGLSHCFPEDLSLPASLATEFVLGHLK